jgi:hypothetical protein
MGYVIVTEQFDYADEFDVYGFSVLKKKKLNGLLKEMKEKWAIKEDVVELGFGTNEALEFSSFQDFMGGISVLPCKKKAAKFLMKSGMLRKNNTFGHVFIEQILEQFDQD